MEEKGTGAQMAIACGGQTAQWPGGQVHQVLSGHAGHKAGTAGCCWCTFHFLHHKLSHITAAQAIAPNHDTLCQASLIQKVE